MPPPGFWYVYVNSKKKISNIEGQPQKETHIKYNEWGRLLQGASKKICCLKKKKFIMPHSQASCGRAICWHFSKLVSKFWERMALSLLGLCHSFLRLDVKSMSSRPKSKNNEQTIPQGKSESSCQQNTRCSKTSSRVPQNRALVESGVHTWREGWSPMWISSLHRCLDSKEFLDSSSWLLFGEHPTLSKLRLSSLQAYWIMVLL